MGHARDPPEVEPTSKGEDNGRNPSKRSPKHFLGREISLLRQNLWPGIEDRNGGDVDVERSDAACDGGIEQVRGENRSNSLTEGLAALLLLWRRKVQGDIVLAVVAA